MGKRTRTMPGKFTESLPAGAIVTLSSPGGGGFGRVGKTRAKGRPQR